MIRYGTSTFLTMLLLPVLLVATLSVAPAGAVECCTPCHGNVQDVHGDFNHSATPGSGSVIIFADRTHDDAWWGQPSPQFDVAVDCSLCHNNDLYKVHGGDCATCHPTPYDTVKDNWNKSCQQGGCHFTYHDASVTDHLPFEDPYDPGNDCSKCHGVNWAVTQSHCLNCHTAFVAGDTSPPTTTSNVQGSYFGAALIDFTIIDNGKIGNGRTFYELDNGPTTAAGKYLLVTETGNHTLTFWSKDQAGNTEVTPNTVAFSISEDNTPPVTTSNALPSYTQGAVITLTATDVDGSGVKATYYRLNGGSQQTGTVINVPALTGTVSYTLVFWSEDWAGNVEAENTVTFTVTSGTGTIRLVWGSSDTTGSPCATDYDAEAVINIRRGATGPFVVQNKYVGCLATENWSGVEDTAVPVGTTEYIITVDWACCGMEDYDQTAFPNPSVPGPIVITTPGQVIRLSY